MPPRHRTFLTLHPRLTEQEARIHLAQAQDRLDAALSAKSKVHRSEIGMLTILRDGWADHVKRFEETV